jgi:steroid delta-isomerase-like uncharacterized protein
MTQAKPARPEITVNESSEHLAREWLESINARDFDELRSLYADDIAEDLPSRQVRVQGADVMVDSYRTWTDAFSDLYGTMSGCYSEGEAVTVEAMLTGTWNGPLQMPGMHINTPTSQRMTVSVCEVMEIRNGIIVDARAYYNMLGILQQIGARASAPGV